jgi:putative glutamine amidotransferase
MTLKKPLIGITLDSVDPQDEIEGKWYSDLPWYGLRQRYCEAVALAGGIPIPLPYHIEYMNEYVNLLDGLVLTGGGFDIDPALYKADYVHPTVTPIRPKRTQFEWIFTENYLKSGKPILGICAGMELLNVIHNGTLIQHIPDEAPSSIDHKQKHSRFERQHLVNIHPDTLLGRIVGTSTIHVNSIHHQAVKEVSTSFQVNAMAPDGLVEGIELSDHPFCLGLQWHPEFHVSEADVLIMQGFIKACQTPYV